MTDSLDTRALPFDQYQRYLVLRALLEDWVISGADAKTLLDVGGVTQTPCGRWYLPARTIVGAQGAEAYDLLEIDLEGYTRIAPDPRQMPEKRFDAVVASDVLEHVPDEDKSAFLAALTERARQVLVVSGPVGDDAVMHAEAVVDAYHRALTGREHPWLSEHFAAGHPSAELIRGFFDERGLPYVEFESGSLSDWLLMMLVREYAQTRPRGLELLDKVNRFYNTQVSSPAAQSPGYRRVFVVAMGAEGEAVLGRARDLLAAGEPVSGPRDALPAYLSTLTQALMWSDFARADTLIQAPSGDLEPGPQLSETGLSWRIECPADGLQRLDMLVGTHGAPFDSSLEFTLAETGEEETPIRHLIVPGTAIGDNAWLQLRFPAIPDSAARTYSLSMRSTGEVQHGLLSAYLDADGRLAVRMYAERPSATALLLSQLDSRVATVRRLEGELSRSSEREGELMGLLREAQASLEQEQASLKQEHDAHGRLETRHGELQATHGSVLERVAELEALITRIETDLAETRSRVAAEQSGHSVFIHKVLRKLDTVEH